MNALRLLLAAITLPLFILVEIILIVLLGALVVPLIYVVAEEPDALWGPLNVWKEILP